MARELIDLLWRDHPDAPQGGARGPRAKVTSSQAVDAAIERADADGLDAVTVRRLASDLGVSAMSLYTYVGPREDLVVLMADAVCGAMPKLPYANDDWRDRIRQVAVANLDLHTEHAWLLDVNDQRAALGPGTIAKYDHELRALDQLGLDDIDRDAALTFVLDFVRASARGRRPDPKAADMAQVWSSWNRRLASYLGGDFPLAQRVGQASGEAMNAAYSHDHAWRFGLERVIDALSTLVDR